MEDGGVRQGRPDDMKPRLKTGDGILRPAGPLATGSAPLLLDGVAWFHFNGEAGSPETRGLNPRMLLKIKQVSEESKSGAGGLKKAKRLKLNRLSIPIVGYYKAEK